MQKLTESDIKKPALPPSVSIWQTNLGFSLPSQNNLTMVNNQLLLSAIANDTGQKAHSFLNTFTKLHVIVILSKDFFHHF